MRPASLSPRNKSSEFPQDTIGKFTRIDEALNEWRWRLGERQTRKTKMLGNFLLTRLIYGSSDFFDGRLS